MKKHLLMCLLGTWFLAGHVHAQIQKGTTYAGGTISFNGQASRNENKANTNDVNKSGLHYLTPEVQWGKFISNRTMLGVGIRYSFALNRYRYNEIDMKSTHTTHSIFLLPYIRQYKSLGDNWSVFLHGEIGPQFALLKTRQNITGSMLTLKDNYWQYGLSIKPGLVYVSPKKHWAIEGYANILSLNANYFPFKEKLGGYLTLNTGISTGFPGFFALRVAKYLN